MVGAGAFLLPSAEISKPMTDATSVRSVAFDRRAVVIRTAHGEKDEPRLLVLSRRDGTCTLKWRAESSWIWIERIA